ncbi:MAG: glycosyltransferase [Anaerolineaceae bacterium]|nr:glycosyltransferase [Anaerolineaceae bacterium]MDD4042910.1 glycosyltransferase [Anaerolineaceae bacterium]MDD4578203.1 glycosyltransferase [Anaerolineaceae bacterium]
MYNTNPTVSIILPTYNRIEYLQRSIGSVLNQTYQDWELIVWDDGSSDGTADYCRALLDSRVRYFLNENRGVAFARNQAIANSVGEYLAFLDSDDEWRDDKLSVQIEGLLTHPEIDLVFCNFDNFNLVQNKHGINFSEFEKAFQMMTNSDLSPDFFEIKDGFLESLAQGNYIATDTVVVKRSVVQRFGSFNESLRNSEDFELWWRLGLNGVRMAFHDQVLMTRYKPPGSLTSLTYESALSSLKALDLCAQEAISANRADLVDCLKHSFRNAWQNMISACAMENDKKGMMAAFKQSLKYGFRPGSLRLLVEGLLRSGDTR